MHLRTLAGVFVLMVSVSACTSLPLDYSLAEQQYIERIVRKIEIIGEARYPELAMQISTPCRIEVRFDISHGGTLRDITIVKPCGNHAIDTAMVELIRYSAPFDPMPDAIQRPLLPVTKRWSFIPAH